MRSHLVLLFAAGTLALTLIGCQAKTDKVGAVGKEARQAISEAAVSRYPGNPTTSRDVQVAAVNYPGKNELEIHNLGNQSIPSSIVWVNGTFMTRIEGIAPKGIATVRHSQLLEAGPATNDLKALNQPVAKVELQTDRGLYSVQGPSISR